MDAHHRVRRAALLTDPPDTDELLLRDIEAALTAARKAFDAERWDEAALRLGVVFQQSFRLIGYLRPRLAQQGPNVGDLA